MAVPGEGTVEVTPAHGFNFPEGSVLVKTFSLVTEPGKHTRVETRLMTRQVGQWIGYTYLWNDEQTDATLVEAEGLDKEYQVADAKGGHKQTWHFPSRAECMTCHSRALNFVLGPSLLQLNKEHDYNGVRDNQLRTLEHIGVLRTDYLTFVGQPAPADHPRVPTSPLLFEDPGKTSHLVDYADASLPIESRARSYLHANCAICHIKEGGGNSLIDLEFTTPDHATRAIGQTPQHEQFGLDDAPLISPGHPDRSVLYHRMAIRGQGQMPPMASKVPDEVGLGVIRQWIEGIR
jgi:uncharacterized repeat protein (TIGR03806 family)